MQNFFREKRRFIFSSNKTSSNLLQNSYFNYDLDEQSLISFLTLGYVPGEKTLFTNINCVSETPPSLLNSIFEKHPTLSHTKDNLRTIILNAVEYSFSNSGDVIVPLSGGMDSRIILATLLEFKPAHEIYTYTFGVPGSYDFDIPNHIAKKVGTKHTNFAPSNTVYTIDGLIRSAIESDGNTELFHPLVLNRVADHYGTDSTYWSGFAGDLVGGAFGDKLIGSSPKDQLINYEKRGIHFLDGIVDNKTIYPYVSTGEKMGDYISKSEACFWENHVERYTGHHIFRNDMNIKAPLVDTRLLKFFFTLPKNKRENKKFFNESFSSIYPNIFDIPTKDYGYKYSRYHYKQPFRKAKFYSKAVGWRLAPKLITHPHTAYIDMQHAINNRADVRHCIDELISDLSHRNIIDNKRMFKFLSQHREGSKNHTKDIINLASLEVILKAANL